MHTGAPDDMSGIRKLRLHPIDYVERRIIVDFHKMIKAFLASSTVYNGSVKPAGCPIRRLLAYFTHPVGFRPNPSAAPG